MSLGTYGEPDAVSKAIDYAKFRSRSHRAVIRVYDGAGQRIETHEHKGDFKEWSRIRQFFANTGNGKTTVACSNSSPE